MTTLPATITKYDLAGERPPDEQGDLNAFVGPREQLVLAEEETLLAAGRSERWIEAPERDLEPVEP